MAKIMPIILTLPLKQEYVSQHWTLETQVAEGRMSNSNTNNGSTVTVSRTLSQIVNYHLAPIPKVIKKKSQLSPMLEGFPQWPLLATWRIWRLHLVCRMSNAMAL